MLLASANRRKISIAISAISAVLLIFSFAQADELESASFKVLDPVFQTGGGGEMTSTSFRLIGSVSQIAIGTSTATNFNTSQGFLYFPAVTKPVVTATAGDGQVDLSWTASVGFLGWTVSGYNIGQATVSGGPYNYTSVGNVLSSTRTGLSNGTAHFFVVRPEDTFGNSIATSTEVSASPVAAAVPSPEPVGGGGGIILALLRQFVAPTPFVQPVVLPCPYPATDLNCDGQVNLQDLSIFLFLAPRPVPNPADFDADLKVGIKDLSVLFFDWTERFLSFAPEDKVVSVPTEVDRTPGFFERLFAPSERAAVSPVSPVSEDVPGESLGDKFVRSIINVFIGLVGTIIAVVEWVLNIF